MKICDGVHQIKVNFRVTEQVCRYVYIYLIEGKYCYLIDTGVYGSEEIIADYMHRIGRDLKEIKAVFLTHAHPDHIGSAARLKELTDCRVYASRGEAPWIEDIDLQYRERPIPNFYTLAGRSTSLDGYLTDGDTVGLEDNLTVQVMNTGGHSVEELSYLLVQKGILFTGDSIPVKGDIPIYVNQRQSLRSLERMKEAEGIQYYCPAWDKIYDRQEGIAALEAGRELIVWLDQAVRAVRSEEPALTAAQVTERVCSRHGLEMLMQNPLFQRTVACHMHEQNPEEMAAQE